MWDVKQKQQTHRYRQQNGVYQRERGIGVEEEKYKRAQIYGDRRLGFR